uniref:Rab-GAP TBC domain-containing protein n=1 Tax=Parastrongyloides trichosuri TaxID=131310 RepID=A0A0N4ZEJ5_PARTI
MDGIRRTSTSSSSGTSSSHQTSPGSYYSAGSRKVTHHRPPYTEEWSRCFHGRIQPSLLKQFALEGDLRTSKMRSIYWRLFLKVLPIDKDEWPTIIERYRCEYEELKMKHFTDPRDSLEMDPETNNPLSLTENCPWRQFFCNNELRGQIKKDVDRAFPEISFFKESGTREIMNNVLFIYGKEHPHIEYKQGMHEILGPLLFILKYDQDNFQTLREKNFMNSLNESDKRLLNFLNDPQYREHDVYQMFSEVMLLIGSWYIFSDDNTKTNESEESTGNIGNIPRKRKISVSTYQSNLFNQCIDKPSYSAILDKLDQITEVLLKEIDNTLYLHLKQLNIPPQVYGLRWLRLLFGREFSLPDLLYIWDVILSDDDPLVMVDFIFITLLIQIRNELLSSDYNSCLQYLMRYPPIKYPMPKMSGPLNFSNITLSGQVHPNADRNKKYVSMSNDIRESRKNKENENSASSTISSGRENDEGSLRNSTDNLKETYEFEMTTVSRRHTFSNGGVHESKYSSTEFQEYESMKKQIDSLQQAAINSETKQFEASQRLYGIISGIKQLAIEKEIKKQLIKSIGDVAAKLTYSSINEASIRNVTLPTDPSPSREGVEVATEAKST